MSNVQETIDSLKAYLGNPIDLIIHFIDFPKSRSERAVLVYLKTITDESHINERVIINFSKAMIEEQITEMHLKEQPAVQSLLALGDQITLDMVSLSESLFEGSCILLVDLMDYGIAVLVSNWNNRSVMPPDRESMLIGPKDNFIEDVTVNISMIRRRIRSKELRIDEYIVGTESKTKVKIIYMENLVNKNALELFIKKLEAVETDVILDSTQIGYALTGQVFSPFPMFQLTERPDRGISAIMDGRFIMLVDTTPSVLIFPVTLTSLYETSDDYYFSNLSGIFLRIIRLLGLSITVFLPALYIAITSVNQDMFRIQFMLAVTASREGVPYPAYVEVIIMMLLIELINEATVRLPNSIGSTATIVGGLIIGTAAAQSHLISYIMIVITATTAIGSYTAPNYMVGFAWRICSFILILLATFLGLYGLVLGSGFIGLYLCSLSSFGVPYTAPFGTFRYKDLFRDALFISTRKLMKIRPTTYSKQVNVKRVEANLEEDSF